MDVAAPRRSGRRRASTGLSAVIGSWKIIAMRSPRSWRSRRPATSSAGRRPRAATRPPATAAGSCGSSPMIGVRGNGLAGTGFADHADDLAAARPRTRRSRPRCARSAPRRQADGEALTSRTGFGRPWPHTALRELRIERVAQAVAEHVDGEHGERQEDAREEDVVRIDAEQAAALGHDVAPGRRLGRDADAEEARGSPRSGWRWRR